MKLVLRPILDDMEAYTLSIIRMKVPSSSIPLFVFEDAMRICIYWIYIRC